MEKINELTEKEILDLSSEDIDKMVKFRMAEEGIKFIDYPEKPEYNEVPKPATKAYYCNLFGTKLSFTDMEELNNVLEVINKCKSICSIDSNYDLPDGYKYFMKRKIENATWSSDPHDAITPVVVYTHKEYTDVKEKLGQNVKNKNEFQEKVKEYEAAINDAKWVRDEIMEHVNEVVNKYSTLDTYIYKFKNEYLPLSDNNEEIAINFLHKAYSLTDEQKEYVLLNYKTKQNGKHI